MKTLKLYQRENGDVGVRNRIAVISTVGCAQHVAQQISAQVEIADPYVHPYGCGQMGEDLQLSIRCLAQIGAHPNVGATLVIGLGCEEISAEELCKKIAERQPRCAYLNIQEMGGSTKTIQKGLELVRGWEAELAKMERVDVPLSALTVGLECGGSDFTSGLAANPALGKMSEKLVEAGCKVIFAETTELTGTEDILEKLCEKREDYEWICDRIHRIEQVAQEMHVDMRGSNPSPGNMRGGLSTIEEKALGAVCKIGTLPIRDVLNFAEPPRVPGISFMDTPGNDLACTLGLSAGGAHIVLFTTGRGSPMGFASSPVIKLTGNKQTAAWMAENIDADLSGIIDRTMSIREAGDLMYDLLLKTAEGQETASEKLGHREFALYRIAKILA